MPTTMLRVRARGDASVPNFERLEQGVNCFIGRDFKELEPGKHAFVPNGETVEVPSRAEYIKALRDGDLEPADQETAEAAGLKLAPRPAPKAGDKKDGDS